MKNSFGHMLTIFLMVTGNLPQRRKKVVLVRRTWAIFKEEENKLKRKHKTILEMHWKGKQTLELCKSVPEQPQAKSARSRQMFAGPSLL